MLKVSEIPQDISVDSVVVFERPKEKGSVYLEQPYYLARLKETIQQLTSNWKELTLSLKGIK